MSGREQHFTQFVQAIAESLRRTAFLMCGNWHTAEDLAQETLAKAYAHWHRISQMENPDAYVRRILVNEMRQRWRRRRDDPLPAEASGEPSVSDSTDEIARRAELFQALLALPLRQRATVVLRHLDGLSERETATVLGCSEGTVKSQNHKALAALRTHLTRTESVL